MIQRNSYFVTCGMNQVFVDLRQFLHPCAKSKWRRRDFWVAHLVRTYRTGTAICSRWPRRSSASNSNAASCDRPSLESNEILALANPSLRLWLKEMLSTLLPACVLRRKPARTRRALHRTRLVGCRSPTACTAYRTSASDTREELR